MRLIKNGGTPWLGTPPILSEDLEELERWRERGKEHLEEDGNGAIRGVLWDSFLGRPPVIIHFERWDFPYKL